MRGARKLSPSNNALILIMTIFAFSSRVLANGIRMQRCAAFHSYCASVAPGRVGGSHSVGWGGSKFRRMPCRPIGTPLLSSFVTDDATRSEEYDWDAILPFEKNHHNSVKVIVPDEERENDPFHLANFRAKLEATVATAEQLRKSALWLEIPISRARLMEEASRAGFEFHHAEGNVATLSKWLLEGSSRIPTFATHQVGVGAIVIDSSTDEILCVREKRRNYRPWKIPGGLAELGEDLDEAVIREVYEETGIKCRFVSVLGVRHIHGSQFGRSDLFFVCRLEPIPNDNGEVPQPIAQEDEIEEAKFLPLAEYRDMVQSDDSNIGHPMMSRIMEVVDQSSNIQRMIVPSVVPGRKLSPLYHAPIDSVAS